jgi:hypothetical protein
MNIKRLLLATGSLLVLTGALLACFPLGGWLNQPEAFTYMHHDTDLARLNRQLGFVPYYGDTALPLIGVGLSLAGAVLIVAWAVLIVVGLGLRPSAPRTGSAD